jgi:hypothetical protein
MPEILHLAISDEEYLQRIAQDRNPIQEYICERNLIRAGVLPEVAREVAPLLKKPHNSADEEALVKSVWKRVLG